MSEKQPKLHKVGDVYIPKPEQDPEHDPNNPASSAARVKIMLETLAPVVMPLLQAVTRAARPPERSMTVREMWVQLATAALQGGVVAQEATQAADFVMQKYSRRFEMPTDLKCPTCGMQATEEEAREKGWILVAVRAPSSLGSRFAHFCSPAHLVSEDGRNAIAQLSLDARAER